MSMRPFPEKWVSKRVKRVWSNFKIQAMKAKSINLMAIANPIPQNRSLFLWLSGNLSAKIEMKIILSIPRITSRAMSDNKGMMASVTGVGFLFVGLWAVGWGCLQQS